MKNIKRTLLTRGILSAIATLSTTTLAANQPSPFAASPLHLQNEVTTTSTDGVKPNVLIQFDDSGSMRGDVNGYQTNITANQKISIAREALSKLLTNPKYKDNVYWSLITLNGTDKNNNHITNPNNYSLNMGADTVRRLVSGIYPNGYTPSTYRYLDSAYLIRRHLNSPNPRDIPRTRAELLAKADPNAYKYRCQKNYIIIFSDGDANDPPVSKATNDGVVQSIFPYIRYYYYNNYRWRKASNKEYPNFLAQSDWGTYSTYPGIPYANTNGQIQGKFCTGCYDLSSEVNPENGKNTIGYIARYINDNDLKQGGVDAAGKSWDDPAFKKQTIQTFSIGFGAGLSTTGRDYLNASATGYNFTALNASSEEELDKAFSTIFDKITGENKVNSIETYSTVAPGPTGGITTGIPNMAAVVGLNTGAWSSEIRFFDLDLSPTDDSSDKKKVDTSKYVQPDFSQRKLMINTGDNVYMSTNQHASANNSTFDITSSRNRLEWFNSMLPWLARSKPISSINVSGNGLEYRDRKVEPTFNNFNMGDVLDANVLAIGDDVDGRQEFMVTAANDGLVYLFRSNPNIKQPYTLKLNYAPLAMQRQNNTDYLAHYFKNIVNPKYGSDTAHPHIYMINGGITVRRTDDAKDKGRQIFMVGNMGQGGRGAYALNIGGEHRAKKTPVGISAPEGEWLDTVPLFETPKGDTNTLGYTVGIPQIGRFVKTRDINTGRPDPKNEAVQYGAFIANGFNSPNTKESALYIYEALGQDVGLNGNRLVDNKGTLIRKITVGDTGGLATPTLVDFDFDGIIDLAYAGDKAGNMYRFDLRGASPSAWNATMIFEGNKSKPITAAPAIFRCNTDDKCSNEQSPSDNNKYQYVVVFGTGSDMYQSDLTDTNTQSVYGIFDDLSRNNSPASESDLLKQNINSGQYANKNGVMKNVRTLTDVDIPTNNYYGWYFDLPDSGERVVTKPIMILRTAVFTTRSYSSNSSSSANNNSGPYDPCVAEKESFSTQGHSWLMSVDVKNGGSVDAKDYQGEAYVDFFGEGVYAKKVHSQLQQNQKQEVPGVIFSGYDMGAGLTAFSTISTTKKGLAQTVDGDSGQSGDDLAVQDSPGTPPDNLCFDDNGYILPVTSSGIQEPYFYNGKICSPPPSQGSLRRISIREISL